MADILVGLRSTSLALVRRKYGRIRHIARHHNKQQKNPRQAGLGCQQSQGYDVRLPKTYGLCNSNSSRGRREIAAVIRSTIRGDSTPELDSACAVKPIYGTQTSILSRGEADTPQPHSILRV